MLLAFGPDLKPPPARGRFGLRRTLQLDRAGPPRAPRLLVFVLSRTEARILVSDLISVCIEQQITAPYLVCLPPRALWLPLGRLMAVYLGSSPYLFSIFENIVY